MSTPTGSQAASSSMEGTQERNLRSTKQSSHSSFQRGVANPDHSTPRREIAAASSSMEGTQERNLRSTEQLSHNASQGRIASADHATPRREIAAATLTTPTTGNSGRSYPPRTSSKNAMADYETTLSSQCFPQSPESYHYEDYEDYEAPDEAYTFTPAKTTASHEFDQTGQHVTIKSPGVIASTITAEFKTTGQSPKAVGSTVTSESRAKAQSDNQNHSGCSNGKELDGPGSQHEDQIHCQDSTSREPGGEEQDAPDDDSEDGSFATSLDTDDSLLPITDVAPQVPDIRFSTNPWSTHFDGYICEGSARAVDMTRVNRKSITMYAIRNPRRRSVRHLSRRSTRNSRNSRQLQLQQLNAIQPIPTEGENKPPGNVSSEQAQESGVVDALPEGPSTSLPAPALPERHKLDDVVAREKEQPKPHAAVKPSPRPPLLTNKTLPKLPTQSDFSNSTRSQNTTIHPSVRYEPFGAPQVSSQTTRNISHALSTPAKDEQSGVPAHLLTVPKTATRTPHTGRTGNPSSTPVRGQPSEVHSAVPPQTPGNTPLTISTPVKKERSGVSSGFLQVPRARTRRAHPSSTPARREQSGVSSSLQVPTTTGVARPTTGFKVVFPENPPPVPPKTSSRERGFTTELRPAPQRPPRDLSQGYITPRTPNFDAPLSDVPRSHRRRTSRTRRDFSTPLQERRGPARARRQSISRTPNFSRPYTLPTPPQSESRPEPSGSPGEGVSEVPVEPTAQDDDDAANMVNAKIAKMLAATDLIRKERESGIKPQLKTPKRRSIFKRVWSKLVPGSSSKKEAAPANGKAKEEELFAAQGGINTTTVTAGQDDPFTTAAAKPTAQEASPGIKVEKSWSVMSESSFDALLDPSLPTRRVKLKAFDKDEGGRSWKLVPADEPSILDVVGSLSRRDSEDDASAGLPETAQQQDNQGVRFEELPIRVEAERQGAIGGSPGSFF